MTYSQRKILVIHDHGPSHAKPFTNLGLEYSQDTKLLDQKDAKQEVGLVVFTGGSDVSPNLYQASSHYSTHASSSRDMVEMDLFNKARHHGIPMVGICRGAQFLCVMAGGKLLQDVTGHTSCTHPLRIKDPVTGEQSTIDVSGDHHQMQYPWDMDSDAYQIYGWATVARSKHYTFDAERTVLASEAFGELKTEPDIIWYPGIQALAIQFHPEWMNNDSPAVKYVQKLVDHLVVPNMKLQDVKANGA